MLQLYQYNTCACTLVDELFPALLTHYMTLWFTAVLPDTEVFSGSLQLPCFLLVARLGVMYMAFCYTLVSVVAWNFLSWNIILY